MNLGYDNVGMVVPPPGYTELPLYIVSAGWAVDCQGRDYNLANADYGIISLNLYGTVSLMVNGRKNLTFNQGDVAIFLPNNSHSNHCESTFHSDRWVNFHCGTWTTFPVIALTFSNQFSGTECLPAFPKNLFNLHYR